MNASNVGFFFQLSQGNPAGDDECWRGASQRIVDDVWEWGGESGAGCDQKPANAAYSRWQNGSSQEGICLKIWINLVFKYQLCEVLLSDNLKLIWILEKFCKFLLICVCAAGSKEGSSTHDVSGATESKESRLSRPSEGSHGLGGNDGETFLYRSGLPTPKGHMVRMCVD